MGHHTSHSRHVSIRQWEVKLNTVTQRLSKAISFTVSVTQGAMCMDLHVPVWGVAASVGLVVVTAVETGAWVGFEVTMS